MSKNSQEELKLALIGKNIGHSKSQLMYEKILGRKISYSLLDIDVECNLPGLEELFLKFQGISITTPYKQSFLKYVSPSKAAEEIGAINCVMKNTQGYHAENTDYLAINELLAKKLKSYKDLEVVIVGSGVMSKVVKIACLELKIPFEIFSRKNSSDFLSREFHRAEEKSPLLIINCCNRDYVFRNKIFGNIHFWDLNYNYPIHHYLKDKAKHFEDGLELLERQAFFALRFWSIL